MKINLEAETKEIIGKNTMHSVWIVFRAEQKLQVWERLPEHVRTLIFLIIYLLLSITSIASTYLFGPVWNSQTFDGTHFMATSAFALRF